MERQSSVACRILNSAGALVRANPANRDKKKLCTASNPSEGRASSAWVRIRLNTIKTVVELNLELWDAQVGWLRVGLHDWYFLPYFLCYIRYLDYGPWLDVQKKTGSATHIMRLVIWKHGKEGREGGGGRAAGDSIAEGKNNYPASFNKLHNWPANGKKSLCVITPGEYSWIPLIVIVIRYHETRTDVQRAGERRTANQPPAISPN